MAHLYAPTDYTGKVKTFTFDDGETCEIGYDVILENIRGFNEEFVLGIVVNNDQDYIDAAKYMYDEYPASGPHGSGVQHYRDLIERYNQTLVKPVASAG